MTDKTPTNETDPEVTTTWHKDRPPRVRFVFKLTNMDGKAMNVVVVRDSNTEEDCEQAWLRVIRYMQEAEDLGVVKSMELSLHVIEFDETKTVSLSFETRVVEPREEDE